MEKNDKQPKGFSEVLDFIENTKDGKFSEGGVSPQPYNRPLRSTGSLHNHSQKQKRFRIF